MFVTIMCGFVGLVVTILTVTLLFKATVWIICWLVEKDHEAQMRRRKCIKERRRNRVYDNYLTKYRSWG